MRLPSRTTLRRWVAPVAVFLALVTVPTLVASSNLSTQHHPTHLDAAQVAPAAQPVNDRDDQAASRSHDRTVCLDEGTCPSPTASATPPTPQPATTASVTITHGPAPKPTKTTSKTSGGSGNNGPPVSAGGGSGCAPAVSLPGNIVTIVHNHLSGCDASALLWIIKHESGGNVHATNPSSGAYGLPQALPGSKMASCGSDWHDNADTQIRWMIGYVTSRYGGPVNAYHFWVAHNWY